MIFWSTSSYTDIISPHNEFCSFSLLQSFALLLFSLKSYMLLEQSCLLQYFLRGSFCIYHNKYHHFGIYHSLPCFLGVGFFVLFGLGFFSEAKTVIFRCYLSLCLNTIHVLTIKLTCMQRALGIVPQKKQEYKKKWLLINHKTSSEQYPLPFERLNLRFFFYFLLIACKLLFTMSNWNIDCYSRLDSNNDNYCVPSVSSNLVSQA